MNSTTWKWEKKEKWGFHSNFVRKIFQRNCGAETNADDLRQQACWPWPRATARAGRACAAAVRPLPLQPVGYGSKFWGLQMHYNLNVGRNGYSYSITTAINPSQMPLSTHTSTCVHTKVCNKPSYVHIKCEYTDEGMRTQSKHQKHQRWVIPQHNSNNNRYMRECVMKHATIVY